MAYLKIDSHLTGLFDQLRQVRSHTFDADYSRDQVKIILNYDTLLPELHDSPAPPFLCYIRDTDNLICREKEQPARVRDICQNLYNEVCEPAGHFLRLDHQIAKNVVACNLRLPEPSDVVLDRAVQILSRLPARPIEMDDVPKGLSHGYFLPNQEERMGKLLIQQWENLQVTAWMSSHVVRAAFLSATHWPMRSGLLIPLIDTTAELLEQASSLSEQASDDTEKTRWFIVRAFLWTTWQRCSMIYYHHMLGEYVEYGVPDEPELSLRSTVPSPGVSIDEFSQRHVASGKSEYMCTWALELLRNEPVFIGADFRLFHQRFSEAFKGMKGRCLPHLGASCKGRERKDCKRFTGMTIIDQSAHDHVCPGDCSKLTWDEASYRAVAGGARAVSLTTAAALDGHVTYCDATDRTLAISHVWSHGQGGRSEEGINACLHGRYIALADSLGCDSYWMDTPCIPEDHSLRREAISNINRIFADSKATLVCDRDLMAIGVEDLSIEVQESLLVTVTVCDWNVRAWTFLEAFRGRDAIYLLCKDNKVVSFKDIVENVYHHGRLDTALPLLTVPHLFPAQAERQPSINFIPSDIMHGFLSIENAASFLSHRAASRPGDDIVIWSLLLGEEVYYDADALWRSRIDKRIVTSFLVSNAPRLGKPGFGWAPSTPTLQGTSGPTKIVVKNGITHAIGGVTPEGLLASWLMSEFDSHEASDEKMTMSEPEVMSSLGNNLRKIRQRYLQDHPRAALLRPINHSSFDSPTLNRKDSTRVDLVVCSKDDAGSAQVQDDPWYWRGVWKWDNAEPLPEFAFAHNVLLV